MAVNDSVPGDANHTGNYGSHMITNIILHICGCRRSVTSSCSCRPADSKALMQMQRIFQTPTCETYVMEVEKQAKGMS
jgi:hypothetical protein